MAPVLGKCRTARNRRLEPTLQGTRLPAQLQAERRVGFSMDCRAWLIHATEQGRKSAAVPVLRNRLFTSAANNPAARLFFARILPTRRNCSNSGLLLPFHAKGLPQGRSVARSQTTPIDAPGPPVPGRRTPRRARRLSAAGASSRRPAGDQDGRPTAPSGKSGRAASTPGPRKTPAPR